MASSQSESDVHNEENQMIPKISVILCWRCICMKRCQKHNTSNIHRNKCLVTAVVLGIIFLGALILSVYCMTFDEDGGQMICIPASYKVVDLKQYPPEKSVTLENVFLNCWKESKRVMLRKISARLQNGTQWVLDEDGGQMICIPASYKVIDLKQYPPEKTVTLENVFLNCWKESKRVMLSKISARLQNATQWVLDEDGGQMICIPASYKVIDLKQYPPEKIVTLENVFLNCWKESKTVMLSKIAARLQNGTQWALPSSKNDEAE